MRSAETLVILPSFRVQRSTSDKMSMWSRPRCANALTLVQMQSDAIQGARRRQKGLMGILIVAQENWSQPGSTLPLVA